MGRGGGKSLAKEDVMLADKVHRVMRLLNTIAEEELKPHRHRYNQVGCKPHPHPGAHIILCECGKAQGR